MLKVAKVLIQNENEKYLVLYRNNHPIFGNGIDLPGGTVEKGEAYDDAAIREVKEECGIVLAPEQLTLLASSRKYSRIGNEYNLYGVPLSETPEVVLSWEHIEFIWLSAEDIVKQAKTSNDKFLHLTSDILTSKLPKK